MHEFSLINIKTFFILLIGDGVPSHAVDHHLVARHVIVHYIFKFWHERLFVYDVKVNQLVGRYLNSNVPFNEIHKPSDFDAMVLVPAFHLIIGVPHFLEKKHHTRASHSKSLAVQENHLAKISIRDSLKSIILQLVGINGEGMTLPVK